MATRKQTTVTHNKGGSARGSGRRTVIVAPAPARASRATAAVMALPAALDAASGLASAVAQRPIHFTSAATREAVAGIRISGDTHDDRRASPPTGVRQKFGELRAALADGWEIVQPIFARPLWSVADDSITAFNFVLRRERTTRLVTVPGGRTVQRFIRDRHLAVDYRR